MATNWKLLVFALLMAAPVTAQSSWDAAMEAVSEKSSKYYDFALGLGSGHPGTALHGIGHDRHLCAIVGRMLGFVEEIKQAETFEDPPLLPNADPFIIMEHSVYLDSWVAAARRAVSLTEGQKKSLWNLECPGKHGIPEESVISDPHLAGDFSVLDGTLVIYGDIDDNFYDRFLLALGENPDVKAIALGSAGGSVVDAILSGLEIRRRGLSTTLHGPCLSACPLVFAGGTERTVWMGPGPHLGFHQVYTSSGPVLLSDEIYEKIQRYLIVMGVEAPLVIDWMSRAGPDEMYEPDLESLCEARIATWVQRIC